jgi:hypothetical protein
LALGIIKLFSQNEKMPITIAENKKGRNILQKLIPEPRIAIISVRDAIFDVKKTAAIKTNRGVKRLAKYGIKFR